MLVHCWPLLSGERGHYELAAGRDPTPYIKAKEGFASDGGLLAEQLWDAPDVPEREIFLGKPAVSRCRCAGRKPIKSRLFAVKRMAWSMIVSSRFTSGTQRVSQPLVSSSGGWLISRHA